MSGSDYTSRRQYLSQDELAEYANITIIDPDEADDQISQAEEIIDAYVGAQVRFFSGHVIGVLTAAAGILLTDSSIDTPFVHADDYFKNCEVEIIGGTGAGQRGTIIASSKDNKTMTLADAFDTTPDTTSAYRIHQLAKFPRLVDGFVDPSGLRYYKTIPEAVRRAVAAEVEFMINQGAEFFASDSTDKQSESFLNYAYTKANNAPGGIASLIAPKARALLRGIYNRKGNMRPGVPDVRY